MTFHQLNVFRCVVEMGGVSRASDHLDIPQPAATRAIRALEEEFGLELFDRSGNRMVVNESGQLLYDFTTRLFRMKAKLETAMEARRQHDDTVISIVVEAASSRLPQICTAFSERHPDATFRLLHQPAAVRWEAKDYHLRLHSTRERPTGDHLYVLADEAIKLAVQSDGPFGDRTSVKLAEVKDMGFVSLFRTHGLRQITDAYCAIAGFQPKIIFETDNTTTVFRYVNAGHGIAFIPDLTWPKQREGDEQVHLIAITEPVCRRYINLSTLEPSDLTRYERLFVDFLIESFQTIQAHNA